MCMKSGAGHFQVSAIGPYGSCYLLEMLDDSQAELTNTIPQFVNFALVILLHRKQL